MILVIERALGAPELFVMSIDPPPTITDGGLVVAERAAIIVDYIVRSRHGHG
jgi:hypothetical protein